eukprot:2731950-Amphidinium_carterae.1
MNHIRATLPAINTQGSPRFFPQLQVARRTNSELGQFVSIARHDPFFRPNAWGPENENSQDCCYPVRDG